MHEGKSRSACVYERKLTGVAVQIQVKSLRYQLENKAEEWTSGSVYISIQQDATVSWFLLKKLYMFRAFTCPSSGVT
jgi:hypothetical protein